MDASTSFTSPSAIDSGAPDEFFIGWERPPQGYARRVKHLALVLCGLSSVLALLVAIRQQSPGRGEWETGQTLSIEGIAFCRPYPMLRAMNRSPGGPVRTYLIVSAGKFGAAERMQAYDSQPVRLTGTLLHRDGRRMLELAELPDAIAPAAEFSARDQAQLAWPTVSTLQLVRLQGEIIDPKCYLGAMKPGGGKTHKACAALCISGGIPPMLVCRERNGGPTYYLLVGPGNRALNDAILPFVGDLVEVVGQTSDVGNLRVLEIDPGTVKRL